MIEGRLPATLVSTTYADGLWTVVVKCLTAALGIQPGQSVTFTGRDLMASGLPVTVRRDGAALVLTFSRSPGRPDGAL